MKTESRFFENTNKLNKTIGRTIKNTRHRTQISNIRNEGGDILWTGKFYPWS